MAEKKKTGLVTLDGLKADVRAGRQGHEAWWKSTSKAYDYYETEQKPKNFPSKIKVFAQINRIKESQDGRMGIALSSKPDVEVTGSGRDAVDKKRAKIIREVMRWQLRESGFYDAYEPTIFDDNLVGVAWLRDWWDSRAITRLKTFGKLKVENLSPEHVKLDPDGRDKTTLDSQFLFYDRVFTRDQFERIMGNYERPDGKKIDVEAIFHSAKQEGHWDAAFNSGVKDERRLKASLLHYEYTRVVYVPLPDPETGEPIRVSSGRKEKAVLFPKREKRIVLAAGDEIFEDNVSQISDLDLWTITGFLNDNLRNSPYAIGTFKSERPIQDLLNTILSLIINSQSKQYPRPLLIPDIALDNYEQMVQGLSGEKPIVVWKWKQDMMIEGIDPRALRPEPIDLGSIDLGMFKIFESLFEKYETVGLREVLKGIAPGNVSSGTAISQLQTAGMQPALYQKRKLEGPFQRFGASAWGFIQKNLSDEIELPVEVTSGENQAVKINHVVSPDELIGIAEAAAGGDKEAIERIQSITVRTLKDGKVDEHITFDDYKQDKGMNFNTKVLPEYLKDVEFVENDIQFGTWDVAVTLDMTAEQAKSGRMEQAKSFIPLIGQVAPREALRVALDVFEFPNRNEILKNYDEEDQVRQAGMQAIKQAQEAQRNNPMNNPMGG